MRYAVLSRWRKKLEFLLAEEAINSDPLRNFEISERIEQCKKKIRQLEQEVGILQNLPSRSYTEFFGRSDEIKLILSYLRTDRGTHLIPITGIGGVGKTSLAMEVAYRCLNARNNSDGSVPYFDAIVFTSEQKHYLFLDDEINQRYKPPLNLLEIIRQITATLEEDYIAELDISAQLVRIRELVRNLRILLIVDNMETISESEMVSVKAFLYELPHTTKAILTSRENIGFQPIHLNCLPRDDGIALVRQKLQEINERRLALKIHISDEDITAIVDKTGGIPLAIIYVIGLLNNGERLSEISTKLVGVDNNKLVNFIFSESIEKIKGRSPYKLLLSIAIFNDSCTFDALVYAASIPLIHSNLRDGLDGLIELERLSLINRSREGIDRYEMLQLTREYTLYELSLNPELEDGIRNRWVGWYLDLVKKYGGEDWEQTFQYRELQQEDVNIRAVLKWCRREHRYGDIKSFWTHIFHYVSLYGNWDDHHDWLDYLIKESTRRGDWSNFVEFTNRKSWLLIRECSSESLDEARKMLSSAWDLRHEVRDWRIKADLAENLARLHIRDANYDEARQCLEDDRNYVLGTSSGVSEYYFYFLEIVKLLHNQYFRLLDFYFHILIHQRPSYDHENQQTRYYLPIIYHEAVINYKEGNCTEGNYRERKYEAARIGFKQVIEQARRINWFRVVNSAQNWLADLAIIQNNRDEARMHIEQGLSSAKQNLNKRRHARYLRSNAKWEEKWGDIEKALEYATEAEGIFRKMRMESEAKEMSHWIKNLNIAGQTP